MKALQLIVLSAIIAACPAHATGEDPPPDETQTQDQSQDQTQTQDQWQGQDQNQGQEQNAAGGNVNLSQSYNSRRVPPIFLYQANQVESCGRVFGFSGANTSGGWAFGIPIPRSWTPTCDLWKAANEAQENGFVWLSYMFQCSIKTVRNTLGEDHCFSIEEAAENEMRVAMGLPTVAGTLMPDLSGIYDQAAQYAAEEVTVGAVPTQAYDPDTYYMLDERGQLVAQVEAEEYEATKENFAEQQALSERRLAQQENLIQAQEEEIEVLREEAAEVKGKQDAYIEQEQTTQAYFQRLLNMKQEVETEADEEEPPNE